MASFVLTEKEKKYGILVTIVVAICIVLPKYSENYSYQLLNEEKSRSANLQNELAELSLKLDGIEDERKILLANQEDYISWVDRGVVQSQNPVAWIKKMQKIQTDRKLFPLKFNFLDEEVLEPDSSYLTEGSTVSLITRRLEFNMNMLHDLDLFMLLSNLRKETEGESLFFPIECSVERIESDFQLANRANLSADCKFDWVATLDPEKKI